VVFVLSVIQFVADFNAITITITVNGFVIQLW
jgi:hypothetical protein